MATRTIPADEVVFEISNVTTDGVTVGGVSIPVGATRAVAGRHIILSNDRAEDLSKMIAAGLVTVVYKVPSLAYTAAVTAEWAMSLQAPAPLPAGMLPVYTTAGRPAATAVPVGYSIFNTTTGIPNYSDGTAWVDAAGAPA